jgi:hypothetical protein
MLPGVYSPERASDPVKVYQNANYGGTNASFTSAGRYNISNSNTGVNDESISSIKLEPGWTVTGYTKGDKSSKLFTSSVSSMPTGWDDKIDEIVIAQTIAATTTTPAPSTTTPEPVKGAETKVEDSNTGLFISVSSSAVCVVLLYSFFM